MAPGPSTRLSCRPSRSRRSLEFTLAVVVSGLVSCGSPSAPSSAELDSALPGETTTPDYVFRYSENDRVEPERQERYHEWVVARLGVSLDRRITYYKYRDRSHMSSVTGKVTNGWADPPAFAVHTIWPWDNHEVVHVMTALVGRPTDFSNEGIAVAMSIDLQNDRLEPIFQSQTAHAWAANFRTNGQLPRLPDIVETDSFRQLDGNRSYPIAGSFVHFMVESRGIEPMKQFFRNGSREARRADIERVFSAAFGMTLSDAEGQWHQFLVGKGF